MQGCPSPACPTASSTCRWQVATARLGIAVVCLALLAAALRPLAPEARAAAGAALDDAQMERLLAPVALFDDRMLLDALDAAGEPVQVLRLRRQLRQQSQQSQQSREAGADSTSLRDYAAGVRELAQWPRALDMLAEHPAWARRLSLAFATQQADVLRAVQRLRLRALREGTLSDSPDSVVREQGGLIAIVGIGAMRMPVYDPWCVYGPWPRQRFDEFDYEPAPPSCEAPGQRSVTWEGPVAEEESTPSWGGIDWQEYGVWVEPQVWWSLSSQPLPPAWRRHERARAWPQAPQPGQAPATVVPAPVWRGPPYPLHVPRDQPGFGYPPAFPQHEHRLPGHGPEAPGAKALPGAPALPAPGARPGAQPLPRGPGQRMPAPRSPALPRAPAASQVLPQPARR